MSLSKVRSCVRWTEAQLQVVRQKYPDGDLEALAIEVGHTKSAVIQAAYAMKVKRSTAVVSELKRAAGLKSGFKRTHGRSKHSVGYVDPTYSTWASMRKRCEFVKEPNYHNYGGRGIKVCERWQDFAAFRADMGDRPPGKSLDRIDVNGNYEPSNCRWATAKEQQRNKRTNRLLTHDGVTKTLVEWSESTGIAVVTIRARLRKGWPLELALTHPVSKKNHGVVVKAAERSHCVGN